MAKTSDLYDVIIIGAGLTGLTLAAKCRQLGLKFLLLEAKDIPGGSLRPNVTQEGWLPSSLGFIPDTHLARERLAHLSELLQDTLAGEGLEVPPLTVKSGEFKPFVGFADLDIKSVELFSHFNQSPAIRLESMPDHWVERLLELVESQVMTRAEVTQFVLDAAESKLSAVIINGDKTLTAKSFFFTGPVSSLNELFDARDLSQKSRQMLAKAKSWTALSLHLKHSESFVPPEGLAPVEQSNLVFLLGSKNEPEPAVGRFFPKENTSSWLGFIPSEFGEDSEFAGEALRHIKKLVRRAFALDEAAIVSEKITLSAETQGQISLKTKSPNQLNEAPNLYLASPTLSESQGLEAALDMALQAGQWLEANLVETESLPTKELRVRDLGQE